MSAYVSIGSLSAINAPGIVTVSVTIKAYYDGSGKSNDASEFFTLGGYAGTARAWEYFESRWLQVLQRHGCTYLHMADASSLRGDFSREKGWNKDRVRALKLDILNTCFSATGWGEYEGLFHGAVCTVNLPEYRRALVDGVDLMEKTPEQICVDAVVTAALMALPRDDTKPLGKGGTLELYFDKGETFMRTVDRVWRSMPRRKLQGPLRLVSHIGSVDAQDVPGVQAADFLAWSANRHYSQGGDFGINRAIMSLAVPTSQAYFGYEQLTTIRDTYARED